METDAQGVGGCKLGVQNSLIMALWEYIVVIQTGSTAIFKQFAHTGKRTVVCYVLVYIFPYFV